ncbi:oligogalacturonate-specific porin KdgM family protein, partial [Escherichia coli]|uniref:oligogalacturonate-specific porin KdgM family protein n=1 Tax=Escherichia coli TaxID=562 RepID=UPI003CF7FDE6
GPDPRNFNQRVSLGRNDLLIRTFPNTFRYRINEHWLPYFELRWLDRNVEPYHREQNQIRIGTKYFF